MLPCDSALFAFECAGFRGHELIGIETFLNHTIHLVECKCLNFFRVLINPIQIEPTFDRVENYIGQISAG